MFSASNLAMATAQAAASTSRPHQQPTHDKGLLPNKLPVTKYLKKNIHNSFSSNNSASSSSTSSNNEEIIVQETVQIEVQQHQQQSFRKIMQASPASPQQKSAIATGAKSDLTKIENYSSNIYSSLDDENKEAKFNYSDDKKNIIMTTFQITGISIGHEDNNNSDEFPQPPTPSFLKLTNTTGLGNA